MREGYVEFNPITISEYNQKYRFDNSKGDKG